MFFEKDGNGLACRQVYGGHEVVFITIDDPGVDNDFVNESEMGFRRSQSSLKSAFGRFL